MIKSHLNAESALKKATAKIFRQHLGNKVTDKRLRYFVVGYLLLLGPLVFCL